MKLPLDLSDEDLVKHLCKHWNTGKSTKLAATSSSKPSSQCLTT